MNDHGLGPGIGKFTFGHGGADEGFRANLTAWRDTHNALVIRSIFWLRTIPYSSKDLMGLLSQFP